MTTEHADLIPMPAGAKPAGIPRMPSPGEWRQDGDRVLAPFGDARMVAIFSTIRPFGEREANARLTAAAPDMLAALKGLPVDYASGPQWDAVRAAIAKAEGRA